MITIPAFALTGTADFSSIKTELQNLERTLGNLKVPQIKTDVAAPNFSNFFSAIDKAEKQATIKIKPEVDKSFGGGLSSVFSGQKGNFANVGKELGQNLTMGMQQQFGSAGMAASSLAGAFGGVGIAALAGAAGVVALGAASTKAAMAWEDMKTSIGRTTGLEGNNLEDLMSQLQDLRQEMGITAQAASDMVEQAGSIGVGQSKLNAGDVVGYKQEILDFAKATAVLQGAWGMSAEATSSGIGKMGSVTLKAWNIQRKARGEEEMSWADYAYKVGGQTDALANAMGSSEEEIVTAMRNSSGAIAKFAPSEETYGKWQAMASFLIHTGSTAGEAGTQIERVAQKMDQNAVDVASVMGIDQATLSANLKTDFMGTIQDLGESIAAMPESARPDTAKMFGLEGKVLIDKVVADIESGAGDLQNAYDLALSPSNVAEGYKDVADNASKAFDRIGQAFQVSLEKIGGQLLPMVTDIANGIADAWISANEAGTELFGAAKQVAGNGLEMAINGEEYVLDWSGLHKRTAEEIASATAEGSTSGLAKGAEDAKGAITDSTKSAVEDAYEEVAKASKEFSEKYGSQYAAGMTQVNGTWVSNQERESFYRDKSLDYGKYSTFANGEVAWNLLKESASGKSGVLKAVISVDGTEYTREFSTMEDNAESATKKIKAEFRDVAIDISKYIKKYGGDISDSLENALSDGIVSFTEKDELSKYLESLNTLAHEYPIEFKAANLDEVARDVQATMDGVAIKINLDTESFAISAAEYIDEHLGLYSTMLTHGYTALKTDEESYFKLLEGYKSSGDDKVVEQLQDIDSLIESGNIDQAEVLRSKLEYVVKAHPELINQTAFLSRVALADETMLKGASVQNGFLSIIKESSKTTSDDTKSTIVGINNLANIIQSGGFSAAIWSAYDEGVIANRDLKVAQMTAARTGPTTTPLKLSSVSNERAYQLAGEYGIPTNKLDLDALYSPLMKTSDEFEDLDKSLPALNEVIPGLTKSSGLLGAAFIDTTTYVGNANIAIGNFSDALKTAMGKIASTSCYYPTQTPSTTGVSYSSESTKESTPAYTYSLPYKYAFEPLEYTLAYQTGIAQFAKGGFANEPTVMFGEAGEEAYVPIADKAAGLSILPEVLRRLGVKTAAKGLVMSDSLSSWGGQPHASSTVSSTEYDYYGSSLADKCASGCEIGVKKATGDWLESPDGLSGLNDGLQQISLSSEAVSAANYKLAGSATYVSSRWMGDYDRFTLTAPGTGYQSSDNRGYVPVAISEAAKANIIYNTFNDNESNWSAAGMDAKIFALQQQNAGKSSVMPSGSHEEPSWIVDAAKSIAGKEVIPRYSSGTLNQMAVEYDTLKAANTATARYKDVTDKNFYAQLMLLDATTQLTAESNEYCDATGEMRIALEQEQMTSEKATLYRKSLVGVQSKYYAAANAYLNEGKSFSEVESMLPGGKGANDRIVDAIDQTTEKVSDVEDAVDESTNEYGKYGRSLDALKDGIFASLKSVSDRDALVKQTGTARSSKWYMDEFYTIEYGLGQCVDYLSDFAIMQEGVFSDVLFKPSYIGKTEGYAGPGKGGLPGYSNIAEILPQNALEMKRAVSEFADIADMTDANQQLAKIGETSKATQDAVTESAKTNAATAKNTQEMSADMKASMAGMSYSSTGQLVATNGGTRGWGGTSIGGGGAWIGTSGTYYGMNGSVYYGSTVNGWGAQASNSISGNTGTVNIGQGAMYYAEGGITDHPVFGVFGEAGREAFVPISDRAAGRRILPQVMRELGVPMFASGGIVGRGGSSALESIGPTNITYAPTINANGLNKAEAKALIDKSQDRFLEKVAKKIVLSRKRRG